MNYIKHIKEYVLNYKNIRNEQKKLTNNKKNIIFQISTLYHFEIIKDLFLELKKNKNVNLILAIDSFNIESVNYLKPYTKNIIPSNIIRYLKNIKLFIKTSYEIFGPKNTEQILIFHGFPVKNTSIKKEYIDNIDYYFTSSKLEESVYRYISKNLIEKEKFKKIGYTKLDKLFSQNYKISIKYHKREKNIIYAPSWDEGTSLRTYGVELLELIANNFQSYNLFVKLHPALLENSYSKNFKFYTGGVNWEEKILSLKKKYKNLYFIKDNLVDLIKIGDLLITDISGAALEFIYFNKKVLFIESEKFYKKTQKERNFDASLSKNSIKFNGGRNYGMKIKKLSDVVPKIKKTIDKKVNHSFRKKFPYYNEGLAIKAAINEIYHYIE